MGIPKTSCLTALSRRLDWADLHFFLAVSETGSFTAAARRLKTTQPTVSKRLDDLEACLGTTLVVRSQTGITLTDAGHFVAEQAAAMARSVTRIEQEVGLQDLVPEGDVYLDCPDALATYFVAPALARLHQVHPKIRLSLRARTDDAIAADLKVQFDDTKRMGDVAIPLGWIHHAAFAAQSYLDLYGVPQGIGDAFRHRVMTHLEYSAQPNRWHPKQKPLLDLLDFSLKTDCGTFLVNATAAGAGVASMPTYVAHIDPRLKMLDMGEFACVRFWLVFDRERGDLPRMRETIKWIKEIFDARKNPWFREELIPPEEFERA